MMKKTKINSLMPITAMLLLLLSSCNFIFDDYPQEREEGKKAIIMLSLSRDGAATRAAFTSTGDEAITSVRIIVFNGSVVEHNQVYSAINPPFDNPIRIEVATGTKTIYVVTNESSTALTTALTTALAAVTSEADIQTIMADEIDAGLSAPFVMIGKNKVTLTEPGLSNLSVTVKRLAAKINLKFKKDTDPDVPVIINKVSLLNNTGKSTLWEWEDETFTVDDQEYWDYEKELSSSPYILDGKSWTTPITVYVYENLGNSSANKTNATQLEVEATFDGMPTVYRVYINENVSAATPAPGDPMSSVTNPADHFYNIKRNYQYNLTGTIKALGDFQGLTIFTEVQPWEGVNKTYFVGYGYTVEVDGKNVTVSNHDEDCPPHKIKLEILQSGITFTDSHGLPEDRDTTRTFDKVGANDTATYTLSTEPQSGAGNYLKVSYNGVEVNIFTK